MNKIFFVAVICFLTASCGKADSNFNSKNTETKNSKIEEEKVDSIEAPDFTFEDAEGKEHTLSDYKGETVLINFWVIHCPSCRAEISYLMELYKNYKDKGLILLGVGVDKNPDRLKTFSRVNEINYPILIGDMETLMKYGIKAVPTTFIMNEEGELSDTIVGYSYRLGKNIENRILELLGNEKE